MWGKSSFRHVLSTRQTVLSSRERQSWFFLNSWLFLFVLVASLWPDPSLAKEASSLGDIICNVESNLGALPYILAAICYITGLYLIVGGIMALRKHAESAQNPFVPGVAKLGAGGFLTVMPTFAKILQKSIVGEGGSSGSFGCSAQGISAGSSSSSSLDVILNNMVKNIHDPIILLLSALSVCIGLVYIARGILKSAKYGTDPRAAPPNAIIINLVIGAILISGGQMLSKTVYTVFGASTISNLNTSSNLINWSKITSNSGDFDAVNTAIKSVLAFVQIIGAIGFLRGWMVIKTAVEGSGQATIPQGATYIIGGAMAINIDKMLKIMDTTFGTGIINS